jgi:glycosyltransferase involved in cell wall biosynthesis
VVAQNSRINNNPFIEKAATILESEDLPHRSLSIVIPIGFAKDELKKIFSSISASDIHIEFLLVNDLACEDSSLSIESVIKNHPNHNIKVISNYFASPGLARNAGLELASGDYVTFTDSDDYVYANRMLKYLNFSDRAPDVLVGGYRIVTDSSSVISEHNPESWNYLTIGVNPGLWRFVIKKDLIQEKFSNLLLAEDQLFLVNLHFYDYNVISAEEYFYDYTVGVPNSLSSQFKNNFDLLRAFQAVAMEIDSTRTFTNLFNLVVFTRLFLTNLKRGNFNQRIRAIILWLEIAIKSPKLIAYSLALIPKIVFYSRRTIK